MIFGLTNAPRLPRAWKITSGYQARKCPKCSKGGVPIECDTCTHCGARINPQDRGYPMALDHFRGPDEWLNAMAEVYPEAPGSLKGAPRSIPGCAFHSSDLEDVFPHCYRAYGATGINCMGDGEKLLALPWEQEAPAQRSFRLGRGDREREYTFTRCGGDPRRDTMGEGCPAYINKDCAAIGTLKFFQPAITSGFIQLDTRSIHGILNILGAANLLLEARGSIQWIPFTLKLEKETHTYPRPDGSRGTREFAILHIVWESSLQELVEHRVSNKPAPRLEDYSDEEPGELTTQEPTPRSLPQLASHLTPPAASPEEPEEEKVPPPVTIEAKAEPVPEEPPPQPAAGASFRQRKAAFVKRIYRVFGSDKEGNKTATEWLNSKGVESLHGLGGEDNLTDLEEAFAKDFQSTLSPASGPETTPAPETKTVPETDEDGWPE